MRRAVAFIARRYLFAKHKINFITIITYLSVAGISLGTAALIVILAVFNGFGSVVKSFLTSFDPHLRIEVKKEEGFASLNALEDKFGQEKKIKAFSPFVQGKVVIINRERSQVVALKGIDEGKAESVYGISAGIKLGKLDLSDSEGGLPQLAVGMSLAGQLDMVVGDTLWIISPAGIEKALAGMTLPQNQKFIISGIFESNNNEYDQKIVFCNAGIGQRILGYGNSFQGYELAFNQMEEAEVFKEKYLKEFDTAVFSINTWYDFHSDLYSVMQIERWAAYLILLLIIVVAAFNILASLTMSVIEKKRDIGILVSMGMNRKSVVKIFVAQGIFVGLTGTAIGFTLALIIYYLQITYKLYPLDPMRFKIDAMPMMLQFSDFVAVGLASFLLSFIAAIYPAIKSSKINPLDVIRWE